MEWFKSLTLYDIALILGALIGGLKGIAWCIEAYGKHVAEPREQRRKAEDDKAHEPIYREIESLGKLLGEVREGQQRTNRLIRRNNALTIATAKTLITMITETEATGEINGQTHAELEELRKIIYSSSLITDEP